MFFAGQVSRKETTIAINIVLLTLILSIPQTAHTAEGQFGTSGEGYSASTENGQGDFSWRQFSAPMGEELCRGADPDMTLSAIESVLQEPVGKIFSLTNMVIDAYSNIGQFLPRVPLTTGLSELEPTVDYKPYESTLLAKAPTSITVEFVSLCIPTIRHYIRVQFVSKHSSD